LRERLKLLLGQQQLLSNQTFHVLSILAQDSISANSF
jgi:hypothetical protein